MIFTNFIFVVSYLKINPAVHINTWKALAHCSQREKFIKSVLVGEGEALP